jgi:PTH1 family peptidyl-tRNA hydrolase
MNWIIAGLGNPGPEYKNTRHNVGRDFVEALSKKLPKNAKVVLPNSFMNNSGKDVKPLIKTQKAAEKLVVIQDELDLPLGVVKLSFGSGAGGHKGVASIQSAIKTRDFLRIRVGISPSTASGKIKKPDHSEVVDFVLGKFKPTEQEKLKKVRKVVERAVEIILEEGKEAAMTEINAQ